jgi:hypothetical protein
LIDTKERKTKKIQADAENKGIMTGELEKKGEKWILNPFI